MAQGEMGVSAASGGRQITLDPIQVLSVTVDVREVESTIPCGFRQEWVDGEHNGTKFDICSGAGLGSRWLTIHYGDRSFCMDIEVFLRSFLAALKEA